jgi:hypothetical protein
MQPDSIEPVYVESAYATLLRQIRGNAPAPGEAPSVPDIGHPSVQPRGSPVTHTSADSLPIHCLFTAYLLPIYHLYTT